ncbi:MAG: hypothetical protein QOE11_1332 [Solirubrobacteraceae bacterium]|nr:hypothetical protein [Solirubrobacteraceae bacterium]
MVRPTVRLDDQALLAPQEVGEDRTSVENEAGVDLGPLDVRAGDQVEHHVFERAARGSGAFGDEGAQCDGTVPPVRARQDLGELTNADALLGLCLADGTLQRLRRQHRRQVQQRARRAGDEDGVAAHDVAPLQTARAMHTYAGDPPCRAGDGDLRSALIPAEKAPVRAGRSVAEDRSVTARQGRRDERRTHRQSIVAHGIDTAVDAMQAARSNAAADHRAGQAAGVQLRDRDDPVLLAGDARHARILTRVVLRHVWCRRMTRVRGHAPSLPVSPSRNHTRS